MGHFAIFAKICLPSYFGKGIELKELVDDIAFSNKNISDKRRMEWLRLY